MDNARNPYTPNAGAIPEVVVGRDDQVEAFRVLLGRLSAGRTDQSMIVTGLRGVGKTVLLHRFREIALGAGWHVLEDEARKHDDDDFRRAFAAKLRAALLELSPRARWRDRARDAAGVLTSFAATVSATGAWTLSLGVDPAEGRADTGDLALDLTDVLVAVGEAARQHHTGLAILIDEIQFLSSTQLEAIIQAMHKTVQRQLPVTLVGAGLPQIAELAGDAKSYSERLFKFPEIRSLTDEDARAAFSGPAATEGVSVTDDAATAAAELTGGYPYFIQELGYQTWSIATGPTITQNDVLTAQAAYEAKLDSSFFRVRLDRATQLQIAYLRAMAELGPEPQKAADVARLLARESTQVAPTRAELINMGLLYTPEHGYAAFTVPDFDRFLLRAVPELVIPPQRSPRRRGSRRRH
ncbi:MAG: ATP-binding protein [Pseudoclavibacter sp.]